MPAFSFRHIKDLYPIFWSKSRELTETLVNSPQLTEWDGEKSHPIIEVSEWFSRATLDIIGVAGLGHDFNALQDPNNELNQAYRTVFSANTAARILGILGIFLPFSILRRLPVKRNREVADASAYIRRVCRDLVQQKKGSDSKVSVDILSVALKSAYLPTTTLSINS